MTETASALDPVIARARALFGDARWSEGYELLHDELAQHTGPSERLRLQLALVDGYSEEDWARGLTNRDAKRALLDQVEQQLAHASDEMRAEALFQRGMALHIEFVMDHGDLDRELQCFTDSADLFATVDDGVEGACLATAMIGIFHHVDRLDRQTAEPILQRAYDMAPTDTPSFGKSEAARHLGQICQELGDPGGALPMLRESLELRERAGASRLLPSALHALGYAKLDAGDIDGARADLARAREIGEELGIGFWLAMIARTEADIELSRLVGPNLWRRSHP